MTYLIDELRSYMERVFPLPRSLTSEANRETLRILRELVPLTMIEYPSGMKLYDEWVVPDEWQFQDPWKDFGVSRQWLNQSGRLDLSKYAGGYFAGSMTVAEYRIKGRCLQEYLISTYICHPSLANDNCSGMVLTAFLARELAKRDLNYSWRIVWVPETVGAIAYLFNNEAAMQAIDAGLVVTCVGLDENPTWKQSFDLTHRINSVVERVLVEWGVVTLPYPFDYHGSDERQYSQRGFGINCASIFAGKYYDYPEYHTSADNLGIISYESMEGMLNLYLEVIDWLDKDLVYTNPNPMCEPKLGERGLYDQSDTDVVLGLLFEADGKKPLSEISKRLGVTVPRASAVAGRLVELGLLEEETICKSG